MRIFCNFFIALAGFFSLFTVSPAVSAAPGKDPVMTSSPEAWVLVDGISGFVMSASNKDKALSPGELVHLMVIYTALDAVAGDKNALSAPVSITAADVMRSSNSRRLYLVPGEPHPLRTLLHSIAVTGAEDAVLAVAAHFDKEANAFARRMNETAEKLGLQQSRFVSPMEHADNRMSAHDLARLAIAVKKRFPQAYQWFFEKEFVFTTHSLRNRNQLLWRGAGIDGVMSNANNTSVIGSWHRDRNKNVMPRDVIAVLLGGQTSDLTTADVQTLLRHGRLEYETLRLFPANTLVTKIDILTGNREKLEVGSADAIWVTVPRQDIVSRGLGGFTTQFEYMSPAVAPVKTGEVVGKLRVYFQNKHINDFDLVAMHDVGPGSFLSRFVDSVRLRMKPADNQNEPVAVEVRREDTAKKTQP